MARNPRDRFSSAKEMRAALEEVTYENVNAVLFTVDTDTFTTNASLFGGAPLRSRWRHIYKGKQGWATLLVGALVITALIFKRNAAPESPSGIDSAAVSVPRSRRETPAVIPVSLNIPKREAASGEASPNQEVSEEKRVVSDTPPPPSEESLDLKGEFSSSENRRSHTPRSQTKDKNTAKHKSEKQKPLLIEGRFDTKFTTQF